VASGSAIVPAPPSTPPGATYQSRAATGTAAIDAAVNAAMHTRRRSTIDATSIRSFNRSAVVRKDGVTAVTSGAFPRLQTTSSASGVIEVPRN